MILALLALVFAALAIQGSRNQRRADALLTDPRYARALEFLRDAPASEARPGPSSGSRPRPPRCSTLVSQGVKEQQARRGVVLLQTAYGPKEPPAAAQAAAPPS